MNMSPSPRRNLALFLAAIIASGAAGGIYDTVFNNFVADTFHISAVTRGRLEFPRELPGFLTALFAGLLCFLPETWIGAFAGLCVAAGLFGMAAWGAHWLPMLAFMVLWSCGTHLGMPVRASLGLALSAGRGREGRRLGQIGAAGTAATVLGCGVVWIMFHQSAHAYGAAFAAGGVLALAGVLCMALMRMPGAHLRRPQFVWRREYALFYWLAVTFGARKQIFLTFGPWVLVKLFHQPPQVFAQLGLAGALVGMVFQPWLGALIDRFGERRVLMADSVCLLAICVGYGLADRLPLPGLALGVLYVCYVGDLLLFGVNMARSTYLAKIAVRPEDVAPTLSLEVTINHVVSMSVPALGGLVWARWGHGAVFLAAGGVALAMLALTSRVRIPAAGAHGQCL